MHQHQQQHQQHHHQQQQQRQHDEPHLHQQQQQSHCHAHVYATAAEQQQPATPHRHSQQQQAPQRKHNSHSPHHSRHTSPHSHHSHSLHSSPHQSHHYVHDTDESPTRISSSHARPSTHSSSSHAHHHHTHRRRRRQYGHNHQHSHNGGGGGGGGGGGSGGGSANSSIHGPHGGGPRANTSSHAEHSSARHSHHSSGCARRHRSATDVSSTSINTCHDPLCTDREVQEILVRKSCCTSSRTELAQYFAEDLYGSSRRPSSCCTSSDYCYQTDSTSLYGSRSTLSRNNSIKSASVAMRKRRLHQRQPSYTSISLRGLNSSRPNSQLGSLTSIFDRAKKMGSGPVAAAAVADGNGKMIVSPSKVTIERQGSKDDLPDYACSPSPIRWSFLADGKSPTEFEDDGGESKDAWISDNTLPRERTKHDHRRTSTHQRGWKTTFDDRPSTSTASRKCRDSPFTCDFEESTTVLFHQEGEAFNNCCSNYVQCNTYLDQDLQITSEDIHQYLSKGNQQGGDILNNSKNYPFQPSNALEFQYKNNFANNNTNTASSEGGDSLRGTYDGRFRCNSSKETNLNQNTSVGGAVGGTEAGAAGCTASSCSSTPLSPTNINLSSSTNNINIVFTNTCMERNANEVKFINTTRENVVSTEAQHSGYLPYTFPTYDYTNMSANSLFDKPLCIDELPKDFTQMNSAADATMETTTAAIGSSSEAGQHSSSLQSPIQAGLSFDSFDAASQRQLLSSSHRGSCQFSPSTSRTPLSPASSSSCLSASINPAAASYVHHAHHPCNPYQRHRHEQHRQHHHHQNHHDHDHHQYHQQQQPQELQSSVAVTAASNHHHHSPKQQQQQQAHLHHHHHHHFTENFKFSNAFKKVRKRARKYTDFLRNK